MATGKSVNLRVRPIVSVDLSYPVEGVIMYQLGTPVGPPFVPPVPTALGKKVQGLGLLGLYVMLSQTVTGDDSRLLWNSERIYDYLFNKPGKGPSSVPGVTLLSHLRNWSEAAALDRAILMRQNAYLTSYSPEVLCQVLRVYYDNPPDQSAVRHRLLKTIEDDAGRIHQGLSDSYTKNAKSGWQGVIEFPTNDNKASQFTKAGIDPVHFAGFSTQYGYDFRYPSAENDLRYHMSRAAVRQDFLNAWRMSEMCRNGEKTFSNELYAIDLSILKLQSAYIDTFLVTPSSGIVTNVFHGAGDFVRAGEPVLRVETDEWVYLVGTVKYRGMLRIGSLVDVTTTLFDAAGAAPTTVSGEVVAVRGHDAVSEQWDLLLSCSNRTAAGDPILPLNYNFDFETTTIDVVKF
jgi:hypothetical protein